MTSAAFHELVQYEIGGGWGTDEPDPESAIGYVIRGTDIPRVAVGDVTTVPLRFHKESNLASRMLEPGDIVFEVSGGSKGQPVGRALQISESVLRKFDKPVMCASFCKLVRIDRQKAEPGYVFRVLQAAYSDGRLDKYQVQSTGITNFKWKPFLEHFSVALPERSAQVRMAATLDVFDELIKNDRRRVHVLEEMARAIYREWFVKFRYPGHESVPLADTVLGPIPERWEVKTIAELSALIARGIAPKYADDGESTVLNQKCVRDERVSFGPSRQQKKPIPAVKEVRSGDVLINSTGVGTLGRVALFRGTRTGVTVDSHVTIARPHDERLNPWYGASLVAKRPEFERLGTGSTGQTELSRSDIGAIAVALPTADILAEFARAVWPLLGEADALLEASTLTASLRDLLLPKLASGEIDVLSLDLDRVLEEAVA